MKNNKVCIVTGASRGLGRGIALVLAQEEGCTVYATARNEEALKALAEEAATGTKGGVVKVCTLDQSDDAAVQDFVEQVKSKENQVDLLVNSAFAGLIAITPHFGKPFWERPLSVFDASLNIGLRSAHVMSALVATLMVKNKAGLMVQVSSFGGPLPQLLGRQAGSLRHRRQLRPGDPGVNPGRGAGKMGEAAVGSGDDVLPAYQTGVLDNALLDQLRVLDKVCGRVQHARDE